MNRYNCGDRAAMKKYLYLCLLGFFLFTTQIAGSKKKHHKAHHHGMSQLNIVQDKDELFFEFEIPSHDLVGFEYFPKTTEEKNAVNNSLNILKKSESLLVISPEGGCTLKKPVEINSKLIADQKVDIANKELNKGHSDFRITLAYNCKIMAKVDSVDVEVFNKFSRIQNIKVKGVTPKGSIAQTVSRKNNRINFNK